VAGRGAGRTLLPNSPAPGNLNNVQARDWYNAQVAKINEVEEAMRASGASAKEIFEANTLLRNQAKLAARAMMQDQSLAKSLPPPMTPEETLAKYGGDYEAAIEASKRTNQAVNEMIEQLRYDTGGQQ